MVRTDGPQSQACGIETDQSSIYIGHKMTTCTALPAQWASQLTRLALRYCCGLTGLYSTSFMLCCCGRDRVTLTSRATGSSARGEIRSVPVPTSRHMAVLIILITIDSNFDTVIFQVAIPIWRFHPRAHRNSRGAMSR